MRKTILMLSVSVLCTGFVNAQVYLGGSLGVSTESTKPEVGYKTTGTSFSLAPEVGYGISDKFDIGIALGFSNSKTKQEIPSGTGTETVETKNNRWAVSPYARLSVVEFGKFSVWGQGNLFVGGEKQDNPNNSTQKTTSFGLTIQPVLKYNLSDHFSLLANLNFLNLGFSQDKKKVEIPATPTTTTTTTNFGFGVDAGNVATLGAIAVGFVYKF
jgi:hypothetical protein